LASFHAVGAPLMIARSYDVRDRRKRSDRNPFADVAEKFTAPPGGAGGNLPQRSVIVGVGDPIPAAAKIEALTLPGVVATR
jgi:hypothetical protein